MRPERWQQIDGLFDAALRVEPENRENWLRRACGADAELRVELDRLLAQDDQAAIDGFLSPPDSMELLRDSMASTLPRSAEDRAGVPVRIESGATDIVVRDSDGFAPKAVIAAQIESRALTETASLAQSRVRDLAILFLLIIGMILVWRNLVRRHFDVTIFSLHVLTVLALGAVVWRLSRPRPLSVSRVRLVEFAMIAAIAGVFAYTQYLSMLEYSLRDDATRAQFVLKNRVLLTAILILGYGVYSPKSWRRVALVAAPLALLPFATVLVMFLRHPAAMSWIWRVAEERGGGLIGLFGLDLLMLLILAVGAASGAHTISRLRRQVAEARQLGQYRLGQRIGAGGMGEVYLAEHQLLKRPCALKLIRPSDMADPRALERFEREVRITAKLSHWNTVEIFDYGRTEDGTYYYVMEYLPGLSLAELVRLHGPVPPGRVVYLVRQVCLALREAHSAGLIHRDIKPSNIFAARRGGIDDVAKLLDFGLVRSADLVRSRRQSGEGEILGTPLFMSPEQATGGRNVDERSDIYSLGAVAYHLLTGRPPFNEGSGLGVMIAHARDPVAPPSEFQHGIPGDLEQVVLRCLAKDPSDRYPDAGSLERALALCACASEWDQNHASIWWQDQRRKSTDGSRSDEPAIDQGDGANLVTQTLPRRNGVVKS
jgi:eukaryotic-like serine/threonine-protein kinase